MKLGQVTKLDKKKHGKLVYTDTHTHTPSHMHTRTRTHTHTHTHTHTLSPLGTPFLKKILRTATSAQKFENVVSRNSFDAFPWC